MKLLLLGKDGQVGEALRPALAGLGEIVALGRADADFERPDELARRVASERADIIVNAAAYTAVDKAETDGERARLVNAGSVARLADIARQQRAWLVHYSTDYVYDGEKAGPYVETDEPRPLGVYGAAKLAGDRAIADVGCKHLIFRVSWVYAAGHANFGASMLRLAADRQSLDVVADQVGAPTSARLIAAVTAEALRQLIDAPAGDERSGLYHLAAADAVSRRDYAAFLVDAALARGARLALVPDAIRAIATADYPLPAARPLNSRLDTTKLQKTFGISLPPWQEDATAWVAETMGGR